MTAPRKSPKAPEEVANKSGYPFQLAVQHLISTHSAEHQHSVLSTEHPWRDDSSGESGYADIVLGCDQVFRLVVECKRASDAIWVFLIPEEEPAERRRIRLHWTDAQQGKSDIVDVADVDFLPASLEAEFCATNHDSQQKTLDPHARALLTATRAIAQQENELCVDRQRMLLAPMIVTNARLFAWSFDAAKVPLSTGEVAGSCPVEIGWIRFRKSLSSDPMRESDNLRTLADVRAVSDRTVLVVNASHLIRFLTELRIDASEYPWDRGL